MAARILCDIWRCELQLPQFEDAIRQPGLTDRIVIRGGRKTLANHAAGDNGVKEDALAGSTPRRVWPVLVTELFGHFPEQVHGVGWGVVVVGGALRSQRQRVCIARAGREEKTQMAKKGTSDHTTALPEIRLFYADRWPVDWV